MRRKQPKGRTLQRSIRDDSQLSEVLPEFMHGHQKKLLFFVRCLRRYASENGLQAEQVKVLEIGCGNGQNVAIPLARVGFDVTGIDPHEPSIEFAKRSSRRNLHFVHSSYERFASEETFDVVVLSDVLEHVGDPEALLNSAGARLKERGEVLISIPNGFGPYEAEQYLVRVRVLWLPLVLVRSVVKLAVLGKHLLFRGRQREVLSHEMPPCNEESRHIQHFTMKSFDASVRRARLEIVERKNGSWFGGDLTYFAFYFLPFLVPLTLNIADYLPSALVSTWYFRCLKRPDRPNGL